MNKKQLIVAWTAGGIISLMLTCSVLRLNYMKTATMSRLPRTAEEQTFVEYKEHFGGTATITKPKYSKIEIENQRNLMLVLFLISLFFSGMLVYTFKDKKR